MISENNNDEIIEEMLKEKSIEEWLNPPQREFSEAEHKSALARIVFDNVISDYFYTIEKYLEYVKDKSIQDEKERELFKLAYNTITEFNKDLYREDIDENADWWDRFVWGDIDKYLKDDLTSQHIGDCTAHAAGCVRCLAEEYYKIENTANWNKCVGNKLVYLKNNKNERI